MTTTCFLAVYLVDCEGGFMMMMPKTLSASQMANYLAEEVQRSAVRA